MDIEDEKIYKDMIIAGIKLEARCTTTSLAIVYYYEIGSKLPTDVKICKY
uniref:Uncharacterized protein n=1 Tax=Romanomermis culicivorax TaxID=13658 RepID=A0A915IUH7_ROMCU